jgi:hypothetical protein
LYEAVIIDVNTVVYTVCKCARRFNPSPIHIKELVSLKSGGFSVNLMFMECKIGFAKVQGFFIKLPSIQCALFLLKFSWSFLFHQSLGFFCKIAISRVRVNLVKV